MSKDDFRNLRGKEICQNKCKQMRNSLQKKPQEGTERKILPNPPALWVRVLKVLEMGLGSEWCLYKLGAGYPYSMGAHRVCVTCTDTRCKG